MMGDHDLKSKYNPTAAGSQSYSFRKPSGTTTEAQKPTNVTIRFSLGNLERRCLIRSVALAHLQQLLHSRIPLMVTLKQENPLSGNTSILRSRNSNRHRRRYRHENFSLRSFERIGHFFDIVCRRCTGNNTACTDSSQHGYRIPDGVGTEQSHRFARLKAIFSHKGRREVGCVVLEGIIPDSFFGYRIAETCQFSCWRSTKT